MTSYTARSVYAALFFFFLGGVALGLWGRVFWRQDQAIVREANVINKLRDQCFTGAAWNGLQWDNQTGRWIVVP